VTAPIEEAPQDDHPRHTRTARDGDAGLTLEGEADQVLLAMLADGIASLVSVSHSLIVDIAGLTATGSHGHGGLARLLDERCPGRVLLLDGAGMTAVSS
jgi:hypothetical protein